MMAKAASKRKAANGYKLPDPLPKGEILEDLAKKKWKLGPSIGQGGFGEIYSAQEDESNGTQYPYVIKIEPHANGPLFVERKFYLTYAKPDDVEAFKKEKGLKTFGMPVYFGSGTHEYNGEKYRFLVMEKFGTDLWKIFLENNRTLPATTVFKLAVQLLDVLEYIHKSGYIHADIKGSNILLGISKETLNKQVYLVDFGLATKFTDSPEFKPNPKKAHDGTLEYLSRDAHQGVQTRRGDLEILAYNLIQWLGCKLPWEDLKTPKDVQQSKEQYMKDIPKLIRTCFEKRSPPGPLVDFLNYIISLEFDATPDYKQIRKIFLSGIGAGDSLTKPFQFTSSKKTSQKTPTKRQNNRSESSPKRKVTKKNIVEKMDETSEDEKENLDNDNDVDINDVPETSKVTTRKPKNTAPKSRKQKVSDNEDEVGEEVIKLSSRGRARKLVNYKEDVDNTKKKVTKTKKTEKPAPSKSVHVTGDNLEGYTSAMKEVLMKKQQKDEKLTSKRRKGKDIDEDVDPTSDMKGFNDEMTEIAKKKNKKTKPNKKSSKKNDEDVANNSMEGFNDAMKEVAKKKKLTKKRKVDENEPSTSKGKKDKKLNIQQTRTNEDSESE